MTRPVRLTERAHICAAFLATAVALGVYIEAGNLIVTVIGGGHG